MAPFAQNDRSSLFFKICENRFMIHNSSNDPVLIKKISLKIWSLRDEIESRIQSELTANPDVEINTDSIRNSYIKNTAQVLELKSGDALDTSEDEMARAMSGEEAPEETTEEAAADNVVPIAPPATTIEFSLELPQLEDAKIARGKTVLSEINMDKMFFFCNHSFTEGQSIVVQFCIPKMFILNADILYCRPFNLKSRIISQNNFNHRVLIRFTFLKEGERALLRQFIQSIEPDLSRIEKKSSETTDSGESSGFDELDDLGL